MIGEDLRIVYITDELVGVDTTERELAIKGLGLICRLEGDRDQIVTDFPLRVQIVCH